MWFPATTDFLPSYVSFLVNNLRWIDGPNFRFGDRDQLSSIWAPDELISLAKGKLTGWQFVGFRISDWTYKTIFPRRFPNRLLETRKTFEYKFLRRGKPCLTRYKITGENRKKVKTAEKDCENLYLISFSNSSSPNFSKKTLNPRPLVMRMGKSFAPNEVFKIEFANFFHPKISKKA